MHKPISQSVRSERTSATRLELSEAALTLAVIAALVVGLSRRILVGWDAPLWFDEAYTGAIAIQTSLGGLVEDCLHELGGPLYYALAWTWVKLFGASDVSLRFPSFIFAVMSPLAILWKGHPDRRIRATWAAISFVWNPGFFYATEARAYSLLFLLGSIQIITYLRALEVPSSRRIACWSGVSALIILTHSHAALLTGLQGLLLLTLHRRKLIEVWPSFLLLAPAMLWMLIHLPLLMRFSNPKVAWQRNLGPEQLHGIVEFAIGAGALSTLLAAIISGTTMWGFLTGRFPYSKRLMLPVLASLLTISIIVVAGFMRPSFAPRYLIPMIPGALFGIALWANAWGRNPLFAAGLVCAVTIVAGADTIVQARDPKLDFRRGYSWEDASGFLESQGTQKLIFVWDNPTAAIADRRQLGRVGAFFLHRRGISVDSDAVMTATGSDRQFADAALQLAEADEAARHTVGVITLGRVLDLGKLDTRWFCRIFGGPKEAYAADVTATACYRFPLSKTDLTGLSKRRG